MNYLYPITESFSSNCNVQSPSPSLQKCQITSIRLQKLFSHPSEVCQGNKGYDGEWRQQYIEYLIEAAWQLGQKVDDEQNHKPTHSGTRAIVHTSCIGTYTYM